MRWANTAEVTRYSYMFLSRRLPNAQNYGCHALCRKNFRQVRDFISGVFLWLVCITMKLLAERIASIGVDVKM